MDHSNPDRIHTYLRGPETRHGTDSPVLSFHLSPICSVTLFISKYTEKFAENILFIPFHLIGWKKLKKKNTIDAG